MKNPYEMKTPEWHLFEQYKGYALSILTQTQKINEETARLAAMRRHHSEFAAALQKLDPDGFAQQQTAGDDPPDRRPLPVNTAPVEKETDS